MVKLLDEFPQVHQTVNLVPSLIAQIEDYVSGEAQDPFLQVASKPAKDLTQEERRFSLQYFFFAKLWNVKGGFPRSRRHLGKFYRAGALPHRVAQNFLAASLTHY